MMTDILANLFHFSIFSLANICFLYAVHKRLKLVFKGQDAGQLAGIEARIRSLLLNVLFQFKLFKHPIRGIMHAFIFYGFISYALHTTNQMIAGNAWYYFTHAGFDPYSFYLTDYIWLGYSPDMKTAGLLFISLLVSIALTVMLMYSVKLGKRTNWRTSPLIQWFFLFLLCIQTAGLLLLLVGSGTHFYESIVQHFSLLVLISLAYFAYRRWLRRASGLDIPSSQSAIILLMIGTLMLSTLSGAGAMSYLEGTENHSTWIEQLSLSILRGFGLNDIHSATAVRNFSWWLHICTVYLFMIYVPLSKHSHLVFAPINYFLIKKRPAGQMSFMDLENEDASWGASNVGELQWTNLLDGISCIECGRCTDVCPANLTGKPLDPKKIIVDIKHSLLQNQKKLLGKGNASPASLIGEPFITEEELWGCTSCHACVEACPVGNNQLDAILDMRRNLVLSESRFPNELQNAFQNMENQSNPWGMGAHTRADWCSDMDVKVMAKDSNVDVLYWVGCAGSFDDRNKKISRAFTSIMQKAKVNFGILGSEENCTGDSARRGGNEYLFQTLAQQNIETFKRYNVKKIVTACPHCYNTLKNEYSQMGGNYDVQHHSDFIDDLIRQKKIKMDDEKVKEHRKRRSTYHDSCYLGRYNEIYEEPRNLVKKSLGLELAEPSDHHRDSLCCGAGGAQMWMEEKYDRVNAKRSEQLVDTGADTIATACPFCITMISDGIKGKKLSDDVRVLDVAELVASSMEGTTDSLPQGFTAKSKATATAH